MNTFEKGVLFFNTKSGNVQDHSIKSTIKHHFENHGVSLTHYDLPLPAEEIQKIVSKEASNGIKLFLAAGGDGTISLVGQALVQSELDLILGLIPLGTGNLLAHEIHVPNDLSEACNIITNPKSKSVKMDVFKANSRTYLLNLSVGITPKIMKITHSEDKQKFGIFAYLKNFLIKILGLGLRRFSINHDGEIEKVLATEIFLTNSRLVAAEPLEWSQQTAINDGYLDAFIIRATSVFDLMQIIFSFFNPTKQKGPVMQMFRFKNFCRIETKNPMLVQADGDPATKTPVEIEVCPKKLTIIIPEESPYTNK